MPTPSVYEQEYVYWPWGKLLKLVASWVQSNAPQSAFILDYMCGTGFLLNEVATLRPDLSVAGCSLTPSYIDYAKQAYPRIDVVLHDAMKYKPKRPPDIVICTAGLHHLDRKKQPAFIEKVASELSRDKYFLLGEELIAEYKTEKERLFAVLEMCFALLSYVVKADAPRQVIAAATKILGNDLFESGEYKTCRTEIIKMLEPYFTIDAVHHTWPDDSDSFGDFLFVCRRQ